VAITAMTFHHPIKVGDLVSIYGRIDRIGNTSVTVNLQTVVQRRMSDAPITVTEGTFIYVAIDDNGRPRPVPKATIAV
jgi:acyl-CoA thioesterase YciA